MLFRSGKPCQLTVIDDTYNANPDSVEAATRVLAAHTSAKNRASTLILGDMGEVGAQGAAFHTVAGEFAAKQGLSSLWTLGELTQHSNAAFTKHANTAQTAQHFESHAALAQALGGMPLQDQSLILVKGSRFMRMEQALAALLQDPRLSTTPTSDTEPT